ncbi:hypothetical protein ABE599_08485 [Achromobacter mucicolens]|uniref:hypothetical protein n=1 Tax=Achromobacter mucicolens TaxID=1389922 RepID=UPI00320ACC7E
MDFILNLSGKRLLTKITNSTLTGGPCGGAWSNDPSHACRILAGTHAAIGSEIDRRQSRPRQPRDHACMARPAAWYAKAPETP